METIETTETMNSDIAKNRNSIDIIKVTIEYHINYEFFITHNHIHGINKENGLIIPYNNEEKSKISMSINTDKPYNQLIFPIPKILEDIQKSPLIKNGDYIDIKFVPSGGLIYWRYNGIITCSSLKGTDMDSDHIIKRIIEYQDTLKHKYRR